MIFWVSVILFLICFLCFYAMIGAWVYADAQKEKPLTWTLIALLVPNLFGILVYFLVGRKRSPMDTKNKFKKPLIGFFIAFLLSGMFFIGNIIMSNNIPILNGVSIGMVTSNIGNKWNVSFKSSGEQLQRTVKLNQDELSNFIVSGKCNEGELYLLVLQNDEARAFNISNLNKEKIDLSKYEAGNVKLMLYNKDAKDASIEINW